MLQFLFCYLSSNAYIKTVIPLLYKYKMMKKIVFLLAMSMSFMAFSQTRSLPQGVVNSFDKIFPNQLITSWTNNGAYNYQNDWNDDAYFGDFNFDGYQDEYAYGSPIYYNLYEDSGITTPYYNNDDYYNGFEYDIPEDYAQPVYYAPTQYQINFKMNGSNMTSIFKPNGTFIIAKGRIARLPASVHNTIIKTFKGQTFRLANYIEEMITPDFPISNPVYRVKVKIRHADNHILKIDASGKIITNDKIN